MEALVREKIARQRRLVAENRESADAWGSLGKTFQAHGLEEEAEASYSQAEELDPTDFRWPYLRAATLKNIRPQDALRTVDRASRLNPDYPPAHLLAAELLERGGDPDAGLDRYRRALKAAPDSSVAELGVGRLLMRRGELDSARAHLERAAALAPRAGPVQAELARLYNRQGDAEAARGRWRRLGNCPTWSRWTIRSSPRSGMSPCPPGAPRNRRSAPKRPGTSPKPKRCTNACWPSIRGIPTFSTTPATSMCGRANSKRPCSAMKRRSRRARRMLPPA